MFSHKSAGLLTCAVVCAVAVEPRAATGFAGNRHGVRAGAIAAGSAGDGAGTAAPDIAAALKRVEQINAARDKALKDWQAAQHDIQLANCLGGKYHKLKPLAEAAEQAGLRLREKPADGDARQLAYDKIVTAYAEAEAMMRDQCVGMDEEQGEAEAGAHSVRVFETATMSGTGDPTYSRTSAVDGPPENVDHAQDDPFANVLARSEDENSADDDTAAAGGDGYDPDDGLPLEDMPPAPDPGRVKKQPPPIQDGEGPPPPGPAYECGSCAE